MSQSDIPEYRLSVSVDDPTLRVTVIDNADTIHASSFGESLDLKLPRGIYTVRSERDGRIADKLVRLADNAEVSPESVSRYTPMPLPDAATSHEYYTGVAWNTSMEMTAPNIEFDGPANSSLMVVVRAVDAERAPDGDPAADLVLKTLQGPTTCLSGPASRHESQCGITAWSARMSAGLVVLEYQGKQARQMPVRLLKGFQTQVFAMYHGRPRLEDLRALSVPLDDLDSRKHRDPYDRDTEFTAVYEKVDAGLVALANRGLDIADHLVTGHLYAKFSHPLLGLIGAYLLLLKLQRADDAERDRKAGLVRQVIHNLDRLLPGSADIAALSIMAEPILGPAVLRPIQDIPLFRVGTEAILDRAADEDDLVPKGSLLDAVADRLIGDTVWTAWQPVPFPLQDQQDENPKEAPSWVELAIAQSVDDARERLDTADLARRIGVTRRSVRSAYQRLVHRAAKSPTSIADEGIDVSRLQRGLLNRIDSKLIEQGREGIEELSRAATISYQKVYPGLKKLLATLEGGTDTPNASDPIEAAVESWADPNVQSDLVRRLEKSFVVDLKETRSDLNQARTVRDVASLVVNSTRARFHGRP